MSKKIMAGAQDDALEATADANGKNTAEAHTHAASLNRIAAEHSSLAGDKVAADKHKALAVEHDLCASRCDAASKNKVGVTEEDAKKIEARKKLSDGSTNQPTGETFVDHPHQAKDFVARVNELSAKRMGDKQPLMAALAGEGWSLNDLQAEIREKLQSIPMLNNAASGSNSPCSICWVADVVIPQDEEGETWQAIVNGQDGKLYAVDFTIGKEVSIVGEPKQVERDTDYEYVNGMETEAKEASESTALEAGGPGSGPQAQGSEDPHKASRDAYSRTNEANVATQKSKGNFDKQKATDASKAHSDAAAAHHNAANLFKKSGNSGASDIHREAADSHTDMKKIYERKSNNSATSAKDATPVTELSLTAKVHAVHDSLRASNPSLSDVRHAMFAQHKVSMTDGDVARELAMKLEAGGPGSGPRPRGAGTSEHFFDAEKGHSMAREGHNEKNPTKSSQGSYDATSAAHKATAVADKTDTKEDISNARGAHDHAHDAADHAYNVTNQEHFRVMRDFHAESSKNLDNKFKAKKNFSMVAGN